VAIDTNIWHIAHIKPKELEFVSIHQRTRKFLLELVRDEGIIIAMTAYQVCEILELFRRANMILSERKELLEDFYSPGFLIKDILSFDVNICLSKSFISGIHIYDYLVAIPLKGIVTKIYSADDHFQHKDFKEIVEVINPISPWILREGRRPEKKRG
jgi:hypothetical protein